MILNFTDDEIWDAWEDLMDNANLASIGSIIIIRKIIEIAAPNPTQREEDEKKD